MWIGIFVFLIEVGFGIYLGPLPVSEFILYGFLVYKFADFKNIFINGELRSFFIIFSFLLIIQLLVDCLHDPGWFYMLKGADAIIMSVLHVFFLYYYLKNNPKLLIYALAGAAFMTLYSARTLMGMDSDVDYGDALAGEDAGLLKFIVAPIICYGILVVSSLGANKKWLVVVMFVFSLVFVVAGARSSGLILLISVAFILVSMNKALLTRIGLLSVIFLLIGYGVYTIYVTNVLNGNIASGNNEQILQLDNPYNPASLLLYGRPEVYVEAIALAESPLIGYSSHPVDQTGKYRALRVKIKTGLEPSYSDRQATIPGHSVVFDFGLFYGIFALLLMLYFTLRILKTGISCLIDTKNIILLSYAISFLIWNSFFSPIGHLKWTFPVFYTIIFLEVNSKNQSKLLMGNLGEYLKIKS